MASNTTCTSKSNRFTRVSRALSHGANDIDDIATMTKLKLSTAGDTVRRLNRAGGCPIVAAEKHNSASRVCHRRRRTDR